MGVKEEEHLYIKLAGVGWTDLASFSVEKKDQRLSEGVQNHEESTKSVFKA